jgi:ribonuclease BN (tRNA processing enzyme)
MARVELEFLGSGDAFCSGARCQACVRLTGGGEPLLLDCGATSLLALKRAAIDPGSVGWVVLSHLHGDHFGGLPFMLIDGTAAGRSRPLQIAGPPGSRDRLEEALEALYPGTAGLPRPFELGFTVLDFEMPTRFGPAVITAFEAHHGSGAHALSLRVEYGGRTVAYSGDTEWNDNLVWAVHGADLFVCECNFFEPRGLGHLDYQTLRAKRELLDCGRIVLTHMSDEMLARLDDVEFEVAADGATFSV